MTDPDLAAIRAYARIREAEEKRQRVYRETRRDERLLWLLLALLVLAPELILIGRKLLALALASAFLAGCAMIPRCHPAEIIPRADGSLLVAPDPCEGLGLRP